MTSSKPRLDGKVAIVTGAGTQSEVAGTGQATAVLLAREGAKVLLADRSEENANKTLADIEEEGGTASVFTGDVTRSADCRAMTETAVNRYGGIHILFNNVGVSYPGTVVDVREEHWDEIMERKHQGHDAREPACHTGDDGDRGRIHHQRGVR